MATQYAPIAKDSSINTTENTPRNIADVLAEELSAIEQAIAGGSGSGGHTIVNASGTDMTQRAKMQFVDAVVTDDAVNDVTKISTTPASYPSANVSYGSGSVEDALDALTDSGVYPITFESGISGDMYISVLGKIGVIGGYFHNTSALTSNTKIATCPYLPKFDFIIYGGNYGDMLTVYTNGDIKTSNSLTSLQVGYYAVGGTIIID